MGKFRYLALAASGLAITAYTKPPSDKAYVVDDMTVIEAAAQMEKGTLSSLSLVEQTLARIDAIDRNGPKLQSVLSINPEAKSLARAFMPSLEMRTDGEMLRDK